MAGSLGSGQVTYHEDRKLIHFASTAAELGEAQCLLRLRKFGFETTERMPS